MVTQFRKTVNTFTVAHHVAHLIWLGVFLYTLPDQFTRDELMWRLVIWTVLFSVFTLVARLVFIQNAINNFRGQLKLAEVTVKRTIGTFDDFSSLSLVHFDYIKKIKPKSLVQEQLTIQADEMNLRLEKTASDLELLQHYLKALQSDRDSLRPDIQQRLRQLESSYFYR